MPSQKTNRGVRSETGEKATVETIETKRYFVVAPHPMFKLRIELLHWEERRTDIISFHRFRFPARDHKICLLEGFKKGLDRGTISWIFVKAQGKHGTKPNPKWGR